MEIKLSKEEIAAIAKEVIKELRKGGQVGKESKAPSRGRKAVELPAGVYSIATAATTANRHPHTIRMDIMSGRLKAKKVNGAYQVTERDLARYLKTPKYARSKGS